MSISRRNNRALNRVLRDSLRAHARPEPSPRETAAPNAPTYTLCADIPENYNDSYVRAIPKDPQNTFVYWELPKDQANESLFADKGTAHVENNEAVRIGERLDEKQRQRQADNRRRENNDYQQDRRQDNYHLADTDYRRINWDNGNHYYFDGDTQQHHHSVDNHHQADNDYHLINWDNGDHYNFDGGNQQHNLCADAYRQVNRDDGNYHYFDDSDRQYHHSQDNYRHVDWNDGDKYRGGDGYQYPRHRQYNIYRLNWNDGGENAPCRREDGNAAFSEMLAALIARCNRHIADYRHSGSNPLARAISSGLLCDVGEEPRT